MLGADTPLFNYAESVKRRDAGMQAAAHGYGADDWVQQARKTAEFLAARNGTCTIDDVLKLCPRPDAVGVNATGSVMRSKLLKLTGYVASAKVSAHARRIGVYEFAGAL